MGYPLVSPCRALADLLIRLPARYRMLRPAVLGQSAREACAGGVSEGEEA
jgi:hypothetical protein